MSAVLMTSICFIQLLGKSALLDCLRFFFKIYDFNTLIEHVEIKHELQETVK